ncbi:uncharacterized protein LOC131680646 [Topomyia yanbarensis]|uniref:uncharacterized protein LOC131680646 n=1 Tax=Topomyia yanbarensis TaxID=2498891 RepID=UPI00273C08F0|nr:uncharacterized protein LOC131680646 [Topomyia yanbarensis]
MSVNNLPVEILQVIFQYLPVRDRLVASTACREWALTALSWPCLQDVVLVIRTSTCGESLPELENSHRRYRNVRVDFDRTLDQLQLQCLFEIFSRFGEFLERLTIDWCVDDTPIDLHVLLAFLRKTPTLKELQVYDKDQLSDSESMNLFEIPVLRQLEDVTLPVGVMDTVEFDLVKLAPNVKHVDVEFCGKHPWEAIKTLNEKLQTLSIRTETKNNFRQLWALKPDKLQELFLIRRDCDLLPPDDVTVPYAIHFFPKCSKLTALRLELNVPLPVLEVIARCCPHLKALLVYEHDDGWQLLTIIQQFIKLESLTISETFFDHYYGKSEDLCLPGLKNLELYAPDLANANQFFIQLDSIMPKLTALQLIHYNKICEEYYDKVVLQALFRSKLRRLEKLMLFEGGSDFPSHLLSQLNLLPNLKELRIVYHTLMPWSRSATIPGIRVFAVNVPLSNFQLRGLLRLFPSLIRLELLEHKDSPLCLEELRRIMPQCDFVIRAVPFIEKWI